MTNSKNQNLSLLADNNREVPLTSRASKDDEMLKEVIEKTVGEIRAVFAASNANFQAAHNSKQLGAN